MTIREFLIQYLEIEPERYSQEQDTCIAAMLIEEIRDGEIETIIELMEAYCEYKISHSNEYK